MRLTKKNDGTGSWTQFNDKYLPAHNIKHKECVNKLGQLEDIEEELGIDLTLRHKVETSEKLYCRDNKGEIVETRYYYSYGKDGVGLELPMDIEPYWCVSSYPWKDYGKTWALTREELEHE